MADVVVETKVVVAAFVVGRVFVIIVVVGIAVFVAVVALVEAVDGDGAVVVDDWGEEETGATDDVAGVAIFFSTVI